METTKNPRPAKVGVYHSGKVQGGGGRRGDGGHRIISFGEKTGGGRSDSRFLVHNCLSKKYWIERGKRGQIDTPVR